MSIVRLLDGPGRRMRQYRFGYNRPQSSIYTIASIAPTLKAALQALAQADDHPEHADARAIGYYLADKVPSWVAAALPSRFAAGEEIYRLVRILRRPIAVLDPLHAALCTARLLVTALRIHNFVVARAVVEWFLEATDAEAIRREPLAWEYMATAIVHQSRSAARDGTEMARELLARIIERVCAADARASGAVVDESLVFDICLASPALVSAGQVCALEAARANLRISTDVAVERSGLVDLDALPDELEAGKELTEATYRSFEQQMREATDNNDVLAIFQEARQHAEQTSTLMPGSIWAMGLQAAATLPHIATDNLVAALDSFLGDRPDSAARPGAVGDGAAWTYANDPTRTATDRLIARALVARVLDGHTFERDGRERRRELEMRAVVAVVDGLLQRGRKAKALHIWRNRIAGLPGADAATIALGARLLMQTKLDTEATGFGLVTACALRPPVPVQPPAYVADSPAMVRLLSKHQDVADLVPRLDGPIEMDALVLNTLIQRLSRQSRLLDVWALWTLAPTYWAGPLYNARGATAVVRAGMLLSASVESIPRPTWLLRAIEHTLELWPEAPPSYDGATGESWSGTPAWRRAREVFWEIVVGNHPHLADHVRSPLQGVGYVNQALAWTGLRATPLRTADETWRPASVHLFHGIRQLKQAPYPSIVPDANLFHEFVSLAAVHGFVAEIPLALAWMRALKLRPRRATVVNALVMFENLAMTDALEMAGLRRWLEDWLGPDAMPTTDELMATLFGDGPVPRRQHCLT